MLYYEIVFNWITGIYIGLKHQCTADHYFRLNWITGSITGITIELSCLVIFDCKFPVHTSIFIYKLCILTSNDMCRYRSLKNFTGDFQIYTRERKHWLSGIYEEHDRCLISWDGDTRGYVSPWPRRNSWPPSHGEAFSLRSSRVGLKYKWLKGRHIFSFRDVFIYCFLLYTKWWNDIFMPIMANMQVAMENTQRKVETHT